MLIGSYYLFQDTLGQWLSVGEGGYIPQGKGVSDSMEFEKALFIL